MSRKHKSKSQAVSIGTQLLTLMECALVELHLTNELKRIDNDWQVRVCWKAKQGEVMHESTWEGFATTREAVNDLLLKFKPKTPNQNDVNP